MAASLTATLVDKDFRNWLKGALAALFARQGLIDFVENEINDYQNDLLNVIYAVNGIPAGTKCNSCTTANVLVCPTQGFCSKGKKCQLHNSKISSMKPNQQCPHGICTALRDAIRNDHRFQGPSWKNTDTRRWCLDAYQIAKSFMPPDGYSDKAYFAETDLNGVIAVIINNKRFEKKMSANFGSMTNVCEEARKAGREIRHSANHRLSDKDLVSYIDVFIRLLSDPLYLVNDAKAIEAVEKLKQLKTNTLTIHADDITSVLNDSIKVTFDDQQNTVIQEIHEHFKALKTDSVKVIDEKIQEFADLHKQSLVEIDAHVEKGKDEINTQLEKRKCELNTQAEQFKEEISEQTAHGKDELNEQIRKGTHELNAQTTQYKAELSSQIELGKTEFDAKTKQGKEEIESQGKQVIEEINRSAERNAGKNDDSQSQGANVKKLQFGFWDTLLLKPFRMRLELKAELIRSYKMNESMIPASPLVEDHVVPLTELYVQPPMSAFMKPNAFGQGNKPSEKLPIRSYRELFLKDDNVPYKHIYVEAKAGSGKTSFTQKVAMTWCQAHQPNKSLKSKFQQKDIDTLKYFDLLFLLHLRDFHGDTCYLDDLIFNFVSQNLPDKEKFPREFIVRMLQTRTCLVIIDGLDEWVHPDTCTRAPGIPHNNYGDNCTVLTTTRPWKLSTINLPSNLIDRQVEISELDEKTSKELTANAVKLLCENKDEETRDLSNFEQKVSLLKLGDIRFIPYILLQLICIWFDGLSFGKSKCETYCNTIELTLERGLKKKNLPVLIPSEISKQNVTVPGCMRDNALCNQYVNLLLKLGKLAFELLYQVVKESSLVIEMTTVLKYLSEQELEFCLKIGLLSQAKDSSKVSVKRYKVSFQHKSVQEFFAAFYITSEWRNETIRLTILEVCSSLPSILEKSNIFVFVCGMNADVYLCIFCELHQIVVRDNTTCRYRTYMFMNDNNDVKIMQSYQSMQVNCFQESVRNGNESFLIPLHDILLDDNSMTENELRELITTVGFDKGKVKSLRIPFYSKKIAAPLQFLGPYEFPSLETLIIDIVDEGGDDESPVLLITLMKSTRKTLKYLSILADYTYTILPGFLIKALTKFKCLQSLDLFGALTHRNLERLFAFISQARTLKLLRLNNISCCDHEDPDHCFAILDLLCLNNLKMLDLNDVTCRLLHVNPLCLETLKLKTIPSGSPSLWEDLRGAPVLSSLKLGTSCKNIIQAIPTFGQLRYLKIDMIDEVLRFSSEMKNLERVEIGELEMTSAACTELFLSFGELPRLQCIKFKYTDIGDIKPRFSPSMTQLERVELKNSTMSYASWKQLLLSVGELTHSVTVTLDGCSGLSNNEWNTIVDMIKSMTTNSQIEDLKIDTFSNSVYASMTVKT